MTDAELVRATLAGEPESYAELARRWSARITALCHARVRRGDIADDLAQETLLRGFRALGTLSDATKIGTWLLGIAHRACLDWLKAKERTQVPFSSLGSDEALHGEVPSPEAAFHLREDREKVLAEVEALPEDYRQVIMLYYYEDLTYRELAALLGVSPATINSRLSKARTILREKLSCCRSEIS